jgi:hypothetical protein
VYFGALQDSTEGARFPSFMDIPPTGVNILLQFARNRFNAEAVQALLHLRDQNNIERFWGRSIKFTCGKRKNVLQAGVGTAITHMCVQENNDGYQWLSKLEKLFDLDVLADHARSRHQAVMEKYKMAKQQPQNKTKRKLSKQRSQDNAGGAGLLGFKVPIKNNPDAYQRDSYRPGPEKKKKKTKNAAQAPKEKKAPVCSHCGAAHATQACGFPKKPSNKKREPSDNLSSLAAYDFVAEKKGK